MSRLTTTANAKTDIEACIDMLCIKKPHRPTTGNREIDKLARTIRRCRHLATTLRDALDHNLTITEALSLLEGGYLTAACITSCVERLVRELTSLAKQAQLLSQLSLLSARGFPRAIDRRADGNV